MLTCPACDQALIQTDLPAARCPRCGAALPRHLSKLDQPDSFDSAAVDRTLALTDMPQAEVAHLTREAELPEPLRTMAMPDPERTLGMLGEPLPPMQGDATYIDETVGLDSAAPADAERTLALDGSMLPPQTGAGTVDEAVDVPDVERTIALDGSVLPPQKPDQTSAEHAPRTAHGGQTISGSFQIHPRWLSHGGDSAGADAPSADYEVVKKLGEGGMGVVWLAHQKSLNREVALKQIRLDKMKQTSSRKAEIGRKAFLTEAAITGDLNHPNIVPVYDLGTDAEGNLLYSMKCVRGTSWDRLIDDLPEEENLDILRKVSDAIAFAHSRGVIHRDLKPSNIMVGDFGEVLVMDWGTALPLPTFPKAAGMLTMQGCAGTPAYMPPEQVEGGLDNLGPHSDVYLLGAMLFEIVTGLQPHPMHKEDFGTLSTRELLQNARDNVIVPTDKTGELLDIALQAMQTNPKDRYASATDFIEALKNYQRHAESILIVQQAEQDLTAARQSQDYATYARALYGFENALKLWDANREAAAGLIQARVNYADAAFQKEDFDLGLTLVNEEQPEFRATYQKLLEGQRERRKRIARLRTLRWTAVALLLTLFIGGTTAGLIIYDRNQKLSTSLAAEEAAKNDAIAAQRNEEQAKDAAIAAQQDEAVAREKAVRAQQVAEDAAEAERLAKTAALREWYFSQITLADQQVSQNAFDSAREILDQIEKKRFENGQPTALEQELGWEFDRLKYVCQLAKEELKAKDAAYVPLTAVAASGESLAVANSQQQVWLWQARNREPALPQPIHTRDRPNALTFCANHEWLAVGESSGAITLWDPQTGESRGELVGHDDEVTRLLALSDGSLASSSRDHTVRVWNLKDHSSRVLAGHPGAVLSLAQVADEVGRTMGLVTGGGDKQLRYWDLVSAEGPVASTKLASDESSPVTALAAELRGDFSDKLFVFYADEEGHVKAVRHSLKAIRQSLDAFRKKRVAQNTIAEEEISLIRQPTDQHRGGVTQLVIDPRDGSRLISASRDNTLRTWDIQPLSLAEPGKVLLQQTLRGHGNSILDAAAWVDVRDQRTHLLTASTDGSARLWQPDQYAEVIAVGGKMLDRPQEAYGEMLSVRVAGDPINRILGVGRDGVATIWQIGSSAPPLRLAEGHRFLTQSAVFLRDNLVTVSFDGTATVWDTRTRSRAMVERWQDIGTTGVLAGSMDGRVIITGFDGGREANASANLKIENLAVWSLPDPLAGQPRQQIRRTLAVGRKAKPRDVPDQPSAVAVSPDGRWGLAGTENGYAQLIDLPAQTPSEPVPAHPKSRNPDAAVPEGVTGVAFLGPDEVATVGLDGWLHFWAITDGQLTAHPTLTSQQHEAGGLVHRVVGLVVASDQKKLATLVRPRPNPSRAASQAERSQPDPTVPQIWICDLDSASGKFTTRLQPLGEDQERVASIALSADGSHLLASLGTGHASDGRQKQTQLREWNLGERQPTPTNVLTAPPGFEFLQAGYLPNDVLRISVISNAVTHVWERDAAGESFQKLAASYGPIVTMQACDFSRDGLLAITASDELAPIEELQAGTTPDRRGRLRGEVRLWEIAENTGKRVGRYSPDQGAVNVVAICPTDPTLILIGGYQPTDDGGEKYAAKLCAWDAAARTITPVQTLGGHPTGILCGRFSADGRRILTASSDGTVLVFDRDGHAARQIQQFTLSDAARKVRLGELITADLSDDGTWLVAADQNSAIVIDVETGRDLIAKPIQGHSSDWTDVRFSRRPKGTGPHRLWSSSLDGTVKFWGLSAESTNENPKDQPPLFSVRSLLTLRGHHGGVLSLAALPDGGVATSGADGRIVLWPVRDPNH